MQATLPDVTGHIVHAAIVRRPIPLRRPLGGARGPTRVRNIRLLQLTADDGCVGIGEGSTVDWLADAASANVAPLFRTLVDHIRSNRPTAADLLLWSLDPAQPSPVRSALQTALLDLEARRCSRSLAALLGAIDDEDPLPLSALVGDDEPAAMAREASLLRGRGLVCFKVKVGRTNLVDDLARVSVVRKIIGEDAALRLDANAAWDAGTAAKALAALAPSRAEFVEEPLRDAEQTPCLGADGLASLRIALDESVRSSTDLTRAVERGGFHVLVLKLERVGGPLAALAMAADAMRAGLDVIFTDSIESAVGQAATLHVAAAAYRIAGTAPRAVGLGGLFLLDDAMDQRVVTNPLMSVKGPGLGIDIDRIVGGRPS